MTTQEAIQLLKAEGYSVRAPGAPRASGKRAGKAHRDCIEHHKVIGYRTPVCVTEGQRTEDVIGFATDLLAIAANAGDVLALARIRDHGAQAIQAVAA